MLQAMMVELDLQKNYISGETISSVYFGGGTPSILEPADIQKFIDQVALTHNLDSGAEITIEANPDDLGPAKVNALRNTQVNRFSIGIQSFFEEDLRWMNRAHNASEADSAIKRVQDAGFTNITIDLIYGYPLLTDKKLEVNIVKALILEIPHISSYSMTVESRTALAHFIKKGKQTAMNDSQSAEQFCLLMNMLEKSGYEHYEISNFSKPGKYSLHNTNYWRGVPYLGIGPSAHSFNGIERQWNVSNNSKYINSLQKGVIPAEIEHLSTADRINEYIMTSLRTMWGMDFKKIEHDFGAEYLNQIKLQLTEFTEKGWLQLGRNKAILTTEGKLFGDHIASQLFFEQE